MTLPIVEVRQKGQLAKLLSDGNMITLPEGPALIVIQGAVGAWITLDDEPMQSVWQARDGSTVAQVDFTNQVGFHRLKIQLDSRSFTFDFATSSAKSTWNEIMAMAQFCGEHYFSYRHQFRYLSKSGEARQILLPEVHFGWLRERVAEIVALVRDIDRRPGQQRISRVTSSTRGYRVSVPQTAKLINEHPELLEPRDDGPIEVTGKRYWPSLVKIRVNSLEPVVVEHAQIAAFLDEMINESKDLAARLPQQQKNFVQEWTRDLNHAFGVRRLAGGRARLARPAGQQAATAIQRRDTRYGRLRDLHIEYQSKISEGKPWEDTVRANIRDVWEIYQAFVAHAIGNALGLEYVSARQDLRERDACGASMTGSGVSLFYDTKPPVEYFPSWRDGTRRPGAERPDVTLFNRKDGTAIVIDAKFRGSSDGRRALSADLFEMQGYLNSFGLSAGVIVHPGFLPAVEMVEAKGRRLAGLPLRGSFCSLLGDRSSFDTYIKETLNNLWTKPTLN